MGVEPPKTPEQSGPNQLSTAGSMQEEANTGKTTPPGSGRAITFFLFTLNRFADCSNWQEQFDATAVHAFFRNVKTLVFSFQSIEIVSPAVTWSVASKLASG